MAFEGSDGDRLAIRERIEAYSDAVFRRDADAWIGNWAEGSTWSLPGIEVSGRDNIKAAWQAAMASFPLAALFVQVGSIAVEGDAAAARTYTQEVLTDPNGAVRRIVGAYDDELVKQDGRWLFRRREYRILHDTAEG
ncbi:nuclear transport factor 2 family protein [Phenylobacterium montanum]|uniref:Nuclear transport factor 2 family protein n=1 Tax=Phenylobacterium montanum TaxID=2823693 RepID=A0A975G438_9CAUL|nr:nuclear transport factor 2 family protein [Caulobacter sp. S6]QUD90505.1 nuclear transport factor 2 family protein [Caulobacter sp. S6]